MPQGLDQQLTTQEIADLLAFLKATRWGLEKCESSMNASRAPFRARGDRQDRPGDEIGLTIPVTAAETLLGLAQIGLPQTG